MDEITPNSDRLHPDDRINQALLDIAATPTGKNKVALVREGKVKIMTGPALWQGQEGYYDPNSDVVVVTNHMLQKDNAGGAIREVLAHELTHAVQHDHNPALGQDLSFTDNLTHTKIVEADAVSQSIQIAWEMAQNGKPETWDRMSKDDYPYRPATLDFAHTVLKDPAAGVDGRAMDAAFDGWFQCHPMDKYEKHWLRNVNRAVMGQQMDLDPAIHALKASIEHTTAPMRAQHHLELVKDFGIMALNRPNSSIGIGDLAGVGQRTASDNALERRFRNPMRVLDHPPVRAGIQHPEIKALEPIINKAYADFRKLVDQARETLGLSEPQQGKITAVAVRQADAREAR